MDKHLARSPSQVEAKAGLRTQVSGAQGSFSRSGRLCLQKVLGIQGTKRYILWGLLRVSWLWTGPSREQSSLRKKLWGRDFPVQLCQPGH